MTIDKSLKIRAGSTKQRNVLNRAERLARLVQIWGKVPSLDDTIARIDAVTTGDVRDFAAHMASAAPSALAL